MGTSTNIQWFSSSRRNKVGTPTLSRAFEGGGGDFCNFPRKEVRALEKFIQNFVDINHLIRKQNS